MISESVDLLSQEVANDFAVVLFLQSSKEFRPESLDCFGSIERKLVVNFAAAEVTTLALRSQERFDLRVKVDLCRWSRN
jgi:hypothetical protein